MFPFFPEKHVFDAIESLIDRTEKLVYRFEARLGEISAKNHLWVLVVGLLAGLFNGCLAVLAIILTDGPSVELLEVVFWMAVIFFFATTPFFFFFTRSLWKALSSGGSLAFGLLTGISAPILVHLFFQPGVEKLEILGVIAVLTAICIWLFWGTNPRLDRMKTEDWHHVGPGV